MISMKLGRCFSCFNVCQFFLPGSQCLFELCLFLPHLLELHCNSIELSQFHGWNCSILKFFINHVHILAIHNCILFSLGNLFFRCICCIRRLNNWKFCSVLLYKDIYLTLLNLFLRWFCLESRASSYRSHRHLLIDLFSVFLNRLLTGFFGKFFIVMGLNL